MSELRRASSRSLRRLLTPVAAVALVLAACGSDDADPSSTEPSTASSDSTESPLAETLIISESELTTAREAWGDGLVAIAQAYEEGGIDAAREAAARMIDDTYAHASGPVLFKPTLTSGDQTFRPTRAGALAYFVGHDPDYPLDSGFALRGWRDVETETSATFIYGDVAIWMGSVSLTDRDGQVTTVDKSWAYARDAGGVLRIVSHHSSLPYEP